MDNRYKILKKLLIYLLQQSDSVDEPQLRTLSQSMTDPEMQAILDELELLLTDQVDDDWLESIAAASEGVITPDINEFLSDRPVLEKFDPALVDQFNQLINRPAPDQRLSLPAYPTFAEQLQRTRSAEGTNIAMNWREQKGLRWKQLVETGQLIIELLSTAVGNAATSTPPPFTGALRSDRSSPPLLEVTLVHPDNDLEVSIKATAKKSDPRHCTVTVGVDIPSRGGWPHLGGTQVTLNRPGASPERHITDAFGNASFGEVPIETLLKVSFEIVV